MSTDYMKHPAYREPHTTGTLPDDAALVRWRGLVMQIGSEIAGPLTTALELVHGLSATGRIDPQSLSLLRECLETTRQAGMTGQQLARYGSGRFRQAHERMHLTDTLRGVLTQRARETHARGIEIRQLLKPLEVMVDAPLLFGLLNNMLDWALAHARSTIEFRVEMTRARAHGRMTCRFARPNDEPAGTSARNAPAANLDSLTWRLIEQTAWTMGLPLARSDDHAHCEVSLEFPRTLPTDRGTPQDDDGFSPSTNSQPLAGSHVLVVAWHRELRQQVRDAVRNMGLILDYVHSVAEAADFCAEGLPHAVVYEGALADERFHTLRASLLAEVPTLAFIEIAENGDACELSSFCARGTARIGRGAIAGSLPPALMFELSKAL